jgi:regulator of replication initiation timing
MSTKNSEANRVTIGKLESKIKRLMEENEELEEQVKRVCQRNNILKIRNDYLEYKLQQYLEEEGAAIVAEEDREDEEGDTIIVPGVKWG